MGYSNREKADVLNKVMLTLKDKNKDDKVYYQKIIDTLYSDKRSEELIYNLEGYLLPTALIKEDRLGAYMELFQNNDDFIKILENPYTTMYMYASKAIESPLVLNEDMLVALALSSQRFFVKAKKDEKTKSSLKEIYVKFNNATKKYDEELAIEFSNLVLKKKRK